MSTRKTQTSKVKPRARARKVAKDKVILEIQDTFSTPIYRETAKGLEGPMKRTFRKDSIVKATKIGETKGSLHIRMKGGYVGFNVPTSSVFIFR